MGETPKLAYLVCATQRSGSTVLCETLRATGIAGTPLEHFERMRHSGRPRQPQEYFGTALTPDVDALLLPAEAPLPPSGRSPAQWWADVLRTGTTGNGVWGGKLMWDHVGDFVARARGLDGLREAELADALDRLLGDDLLLVHVRREDTVAQAVSLWKALQTQSWRSETDRRDVSIAYHFGAIDHLVRLLERHDAAWRAWFETTGRRPLTLVYEQIRDDPRAGVAQVLEALGLPVGELPAPPLDRQRDDTSREWARRYRAEREQATGGAAAEPLVAEGILDPRPGAVA